MLSHRNIAELGQLAEALGLRETLDPANHAGSRDRAAVHAYRIALVYIISASLFSKEIYFQNNGNTFFYPYKYQGPAATAHAQPTHLSTLLRLVDRSIVNMRSGGGGVGLAYLIPILSIVLIWCGAMPMQCTAYTYIYNLIIIIILPSSCIVLCFLNNLACHYVRARITHLF